MAKAESLPIVEVCPSRAALIGNPSDQHGGNVLAVPLWNFFATVTLSPFMDGFVFQELPITASSLSEAIKKARREGPGEMSGLIKASLPVFGELLESAGTLASSQDFVTQVGTNIPRQRGLAGSSAVITAFLKALIRLHGLTDHPNVAPSKLAHLVLSVETDELLIKAGPQDRVVQSFCKPVLMDFSSKAYAANEGVHGQYMAVEVSSLPKMALLTSNVPSHSGKVHSSIDPHDPKIKKLMAEAAELAKTGAEALKVGDTVALGSKMQRNAMIRVEAFGEEILGQANMQLLEIAKQANCPMNYTGSGGAAVVLLPEGAKSLKTLRRVIAEKPFKGNFTVTEAKFER